MKILVKMGQRGFEWGLFGIVDCLPWMSWHLEDTIGVGLWDLSLGS